MGNKAKAFSGRLRGRKGFTLIEVLATLLLVAIVLPVAMAGISLATRVAGLAKQRVEGAALAENKLAELIAGEAWQHSNLSGDFGEDWPRYTWTAELEDWEGITVKQLVVEVKWTSQLTERSIKLTTLVYTENQ